jgi:hypothetical protein
MNLIQHHIVLRTMLGYYWKVDIPAKKGGFTQYSINVTSSGGQSAHLRNVVFGDVYMCSGQSNMQLGVPGKSYSVLGFYIPKYKFLIYYCRYV